MFRPQRHPAARRGAFCTDRSHRPRRARLRALVLAASAAGALAVASPAVASAVTISPLPGTTDAMPQTQISVLGTAPSNITSVSVTGSMSGTHTGELKPYSNNEGASFLLNTPLSEGEEVKVVVDLKEGAPLEDAFSVAHLAPQEEYITLTGEKPEDQQHFVSEPELHPPDVTINKADPSLEGDIFTNSLAAPAIHVGSKLLEFEPVGPGGLMILNPEGKLLWWDQMPKGIGSANLELAKYENKQVLTWWQGKVTEAAFGEGEGIIANTSYEPIAHVYAGNGLHADIHELSVTNSGQAWLDAYELVCLPTCTEENPPTVDAVVQEIDIHTGLVMWEWHAMRDIPSSESEVPPTNGVFDPYHINSIQPLPEHRLLVSLRDTSGMYLLEQDTGDIIWQIAGKTSSFTRGKGSRFYFQHDAHLEGRKLDRLTLFDDEGGPPIYGGSRGLILELNMKKMKVHVVREYLRAGTSAQAEGSMEVMPGGEAVVGFGNTQYFSEFSEKGGEHKKGVLLFDAEFPKGDGTYRVFRYPWEGTPNTLPAVAAENEGPGEVDVYASWNGATNVANWEVLAGESRTSLTPVATAPWSNFETKIPVMSSDTVFEVKALNKEGKVLATSEPVSPM